MQVESIEIDNSILSREELVYLTPSENVPLRTDITDYITVASNETGKVVFSEQFGVSQLTPKDSNIDAGITPTVTANVVAGRILYTLGAPVSQVEITVNNSYVNNISTIILTSSVKDSVSTVISKSFQQFIIRVDADSAFTGSINIDFIVLN